MNVSHEGDTNGFRRTQGFLRNSHYDSTNNPKMSKKKSKRRVSIKSLSTIKRKRDASNFIVMLMAIAGIFMAWSAFTFYQEAPETANMFVIAIQAILGIILVFAAYWFST